MHFLSTLFITILILAATNAAPHRGGHHNRLGQNHTQGTSIGAAFPTGRFDNQAGGQAGHRNRTGHGGRPGHRRPTGPLPTSLTGAGPSDVASVVVPSPSASTEISSVVVTTSAPSASTTQDVPASTVTTSSEAGDDASATSASSSKITSVASSQATSATSSTAAPTDDLSTVSFVFPSGFANAAAVETGSPIA